MANVIYTQASKLEEKILTDHYQKKKIEFGIEDGVIFGLYVELLRKSDSIFTLLELGKTGGVASLVRSNFEIYVYLKFILQTDTSNRARAYHLNYKFEQAKLYDKVMGDSDECKQLREQLDIDKEEFAKNYEGDLEGKVSKRYKNEFNELFKGMKKPAKKWYNINGQIRNFRNLCQYLNIEYLYDSLFVSMSLDTHSADSQRNLLMKKEYLATFTNKDESESLLVSARGILLESMKIILEYYDLKKLKQEIFLNLKLNRDIEKGFFEL